jgi:hypothetical protein
MKKEYLIALNYDTSIMDKQISELKDLIKLKFFKNVPDSIVGDFDRLCLDIVFGDCIITLDTDGIKKVTIPFRFGSSFDDLVATLRAYK